MRTYADLSLENKWTMRTRAQLMFDTPNMNDVEWPEVVYQGLTGPAAAPHQVVTVPSYHAY